MANRTVFNGTQREGVDLLNAIARYCTCEFGLMGVRLATCAPHRMLVDDQRALDGLLFARRMADRWRLEEFSQIRADVVGPAPASPLAESSAGERTAVRHV